MTAVRGLAVAVVFGAGVAAGLAVAAGGPAERTITPLRASESAGPAEERSDGILRWRVLAWRCGIISVLGQHADWLADGRYCRVRVRVTNEDRHVAGYEAADQVLVTTDGARHAADLNAIQVADQPRATTVHPGAVQEFDVWFDIPANARPEAVELWGDRDAEPVRIAFGGP